MSSRPGVVFAGRVRVAGFLLSTAAAAGCATAPAAVSSGAPVGLIATGHSGGTHYRTRIIGGLWYQTFGTTLLVIDPRTAEVITSLQLAPVGASGPASDMVVVGDRLFVLLRATAVIALTTADPAHPRIVARAGADELGVEPVTLSVVRDDVYVAGAGGVVRWSDRARWLDGMDCRTVAACDLGLVSCAGRRVYLLDDARFVGSAGELYASGADAGAGAPLVFVRAGPERTSVGLMTGDIREVDARLATVSVDGAVRRARVVAGRLWVVSDRHIAAYPISGDHLLAPVIYEIAGARDLAFIDGRAGRAVVAGVFGRAIVRFGLDGTVHTEREHHEAAGLVRAHCDGRYVVASGPFGSWQYDTAAMAGTSSGRSLEFDGATAGPTDAVTISGKASISADGVSVMLPGGERYTEPGSPTVRCLAAIEGELWVGHDFGITVLGLDGTLLGRLRLDGPVRFVFPLSAGGAAWVDERGGFGTARRTVPR